ncbi:DUF397 domain-containing protein [Actinomadura formosensis]|uniref:DUF397 domain-containing protein n=1 Tax=Actinomadura formosensis TaxID=60706 RepID=UPI0008312E4D|nr:DUF397 domain-containing protein [Actinomadura formosensis]
MNLKNAHWRKSSHSGSNAAECVELASIPDTNWRKSSYTGSNGGNCIELADAAGVVAVRDSKDPDGPILLLTRTALRSALNSTPKTR